MATRSAVVRAEAGDRVVHRRATRVDPALQVRSVIVHSIEKLIRVAEQSKRQGSDSLPLSRLIRACVFFYLTLDH
jgi:hypothetical protein